jgi:hypothetical protein
VAALCQAWAGCGLEARRPHASLKGSLAPARRASGRPPRRPALPRPPTDSSRSNSAAPAARTTAAPSAASSLSLHRPSTPSSRPGRKGSFPATSRASSFAGRKRSVSPPSCGPAQGAAPSTSPPAPAASPSPVAPVAPPPPGANVPTQWRDCSGAGAPVRPRRRSWGCSRERSSRPAGAGGRESERAAPSQAQHRDALGPHPAQCECRMQAQHPPAPTPPPHLSLRHASRAPRCAPAPRASRRSQPAAAASWRQLPGQRRPAAAAARPAGAWGQGRARDVV